MGERKTGCWKSSLHPIVDMTHCLCLHASTVTTPKSSVHKYRQPPQFSWFPASPQLTKTLGLSLKLLLFLYPPPPAPSLTITSSPTPD